MVIVGAKVLNMYPVAFRIIWSVVYIASSRKHLDLNIWVVVIGTVWGDAIG